MSAASIDDLVRAESGLNRAFVGYLIAVLGSLAWSMAWPALPRSQSLNVALVSIMILVVFIGLMVWYAIAAGRAAKALGATAWHYVAWILVSPLLALIPIPIVSAVIGASPLSIKFLLGGQLQAAIREQGSMHYA
jgi:hypothetical protein